jgi:ketosteroid isomerase-like protein
VRNNSHQENGEEQDVFDSEPHPNVEMLRAIYDDFSLLAKYASDDIVLHASGSRGFLTGDFVGKEAVLTKEMELYRRSGGTLAMTADHIVANDHFGAVLGRFTADRNGDHFEGDVCGVWRFQDGLIVEHWENCADWPAAERYFIDEFGDDEFGDEPAGAQQAAQ